MAKRFRTNILTLSGYDISIDPTDTSGVLRHDGTWATNLITSGQIGSFITTGQTGQFVATGRTGIFITTGQTGQFITTGQTGSFVTTGQTGIYSNADTLDGQHGSYYLSFLNHTGFNPILVYASGDQTISGIKTYTGSVSFNCNVVTRGSFNVNDSNNNTAAQLDTRVLQISGGNTVLDWANKILTGTWNSQGLQISGNPVITGTQASFVLTGQTGAYSNADTLDGLHAADFLSGTSVIGTPLGNAPLYYTFIKGMNNILYNIDKKYSVSLSGSGFNTALASGYIPALFDGDLSPGFSLSNVVELQSGSQAIIITGFPLTYAQGGGLYFGFSTRYYRPKDFSFWILTATGWGMIDSQTGYAKTDGYVNVSTNNSGFSGFMLMCSNWYNPSGCQLGELFLGKRETQPFGGLYVNVSGDNTYGDFAHAGLHTFNYSSFPFVVASTGLVTNLNSDLLDNQQGSYYRDGANITGTIAGSIANADNADTLDGQHGAYYRDVGNFTGLNLTCSGISSSNNFSVNLSSNIFVLNSRMSGIQPWISTVDSGTSPFVITSPTVNTNLNADLLDDKHGSYYLNYANMTGTPGAFITTGQTGVFADVKNLTGYSQYFVWATGNQLVSGNKTFSGTTHHIGDTIFGTGRLRAHTGVQSIIVDITGAKLMRTGTSSTTSVDWANSTLNTGAAGTAYTTLNWSTRVLSGTWNAQGLTIASKAIITGSQAAIVLTGVTGQFVSTGRTGAFVTTGQTGVYSNASQLSGQSGFYYLSYLNFTGSAQTGLVTGLNSDLLDNQHGAYYRNSVNLTGNFVQSLNSQTGVISLSAVSGVALDASVAQTITLSNNGVLAIQAEGTNPVLTGTVNHTGSGGITVALEGSTGINISYTSDRRTKRRIKKFKQALRLIEKLSIKQWEFNGKGSTHDGEPGIGLIAQEVEKLAPFLTGRRKGKLNPSDKDERELYIMNVPNFVGVIARAVQELAEQNKSILSANKDFERRVKKLEKQCKKRQ